MTDETITTLTCANHPDRETMLRCNRCDKPICYQCAVRTPVGYRCKECVRGQQAVYFNANRFDLLIAAAIGFVLGGVLGGVGYAVLGFFGWISFIAAFFVGPIAGGIIAEAIRLGVRRRRARRLNLVAAGACVVGAALGGGVVAVIFGGSLLATLLLIGMAASTIYARLR